VSLISPAAKVMLAHRQGMVTRMGGWVRNEPQRRLAPWQVHRAIQLLTDATCAACPVTKVAAACGLSRSHFAQAFRTATGLPPHKWLVSHRIRRACEMMEQTDLSLAEIAQTCGFADQSHFSRRFRADKGSSPAVWRRERRAGVTPAEREPCVLGR
jgi:AraC family transcriptional regulator